jgi:hypothetical protein
MGLDTEATEKSSASAGDRIPVTQSVVRHCTDRATSAPCFHLVHPLTFSSPDK